MLISSKIAVKFLKYSKLQTLLIITGIAVGVSVQIFIGLLSSGLEGTLINRIAGNSPQITVYSTKGSITDWQDKTDKIINLDKNVTYVAPTISSNVFVKLQNGKPLIQLRGFQSKDFEKLYHIEGKICDGQIYNSSRQAVIGIDLKKKLGLKVGDSINLVTIGGKEISFTISGFFDIGSSGPNGSWIVANLKDVQNLCDSKGNVTSIEIAVNDLYNADVEDFKIKKILNDSNLNIQNWKDQNQFLSSALIGEKICTLIIQFFVMFAAVLSIINILGMSVMQKYRQIGILKAMGLKDRKASGVFLIQAFILGIIGTGLGLVFTKLYIMAFNRYIVNPQGMPLVTIIINHRFILISCIIDIIAATFGAVLPFINAYKLDPVEVIKNG